MKYLAMLLAVFMLISYILKLAFAEEDWDLVSAIEEADIREVSVDRYKDGIIYAGARKRLYRSEDRGQTWKSVFVLKGSSDTINFIGTAQDGVFVCVDNGVYKSSDGKGKWKRVFKGVGIEENKVLHIAFSDGRIYLGTEGGLFVSNDNGVRWKKDKAEAGNMDIEWISFLGKDIFLVSEKGVYRNIGSRGWKRVFVTPTEETGYDDSSGEAVEKAISPVNSICVKDKILFIATDSGIFMSNDRGKVWKRVIRNGLISDKVSRLLFRKDDLYAVTDKGVFVFSKKDKIWKGLYRGMSTKRTRAIAVDKEGTLWVATENGLYVSGTENKSSSLVEDLDIDGKEGTIMKRFENEPTIRKVQEAGIRYAEVHPDKIKEWRNQAKKKAFLPSVSIGLDRYVTDLYHWDAGKNPDVLSKGKDTVSWDLSITWDLDELIWNDDQTSIDTRSRLMVQLRDDILDEITRTYFERRRLQIEVYLSPPESLKERLDKKLRIEELTADLDALTGGYFSEELK